MKNQTLQGLIISIILTALLVIGIFLVSGCAGNFDRTIRWFDSSPGSLRNDGYYSMVSREYCHRDKYRRCVGDGAKHHKH